jgi:hypothetical protein
MLREKFLAVDRLAVIEPLEILAQRGLNPRVFRFGTLRWIRQWPTPDLSHLKGIPSRESSSPE